LDFCFLSFSEDEDELQIDKLSVSGNNTPIHSGKYAHTSVILKNSKDSKTL
jgi:hypothetical protein